MSLFKKERENRKRERDRGERERERERSATHNNLYPNTGRVKKYL